MRESILNDLYYGRISPWERPRPRTHELKEASSQIIAIEEHFRNSLSPEEYAKIEELQKLRGQIDIIESIDLFGYAFSTGVLMMIDVFDYEGND